MRKYSTDKHDGAKGNETNKIKNENETDKEKDLAAENPHDFDYLKVHEPSMYWFPGPDSDPREIGPYPTSPYASNDPSQSYQFRPPDLPEYFERQGRRRFGETVPEEAEFQGIWNVDIEGNYSVVYMLSGLTAFLASVGGFIYIASKFHDPENSPRSVAIERELPYMNKYKNESVQ